MTTAIEFNEELHTYKVDGRLVPHVTGILLAINAVDLRWSYDEAIWRGSLVHRACEMIDRGELRPAWNDSIAPEYTGYLDAYVAFRREHEPTWLNGIGIEHRVYSELYGYAGTLDRAGFLNGSAAVLDIKTGNPGIGARMQTAAYAQALREETGVIYKRFALQLSSDGRYKLHAYDQHPHASRSDLNAFLAALALVRYLGKEAGAL